MQTFLYYCENINCRFHTPFVEGSPLAVDFLRELGMEPSTSLEFCMYCHCQGLMLTREVAVAPHTQPITVPELYGATIFCADLSASMHERYKDRPGTRYNAVVQSIAWLLRDLAGLGDGFAAAGRRPQYDRMLFSFVRFAMGASVFQLPDGKGSATPYFTLDQLARSSNWGSEKGYFKLQDIVDTVRDVILPKSLSDIDVHGTELEPALGKVIDIAKTLSQDEPTAGLPANYAGLGAIPKFPDKKRLYSLVYTDGQVHDQRRALAVAQSFDTQAPALTRVTVFLGDAAQEGHAAGGGILRQLASPCFAWHGDSPRIGYFDQDQARDLRKVLRMVTISDSGICPECAQRNP
jgi:hypothetical protein